MKNTRGFTFIEIMIVILVFSIGILTVLRTMTQNLSLVANAQTKITASMLAKESMDLVFHIRDTNKLQWLARDCIPDQDIFTEQLISDEIVCGTRMQSFSWALMLSIQQGPWFFIETQPLYTTFQQQYEAYRLFNSNKIYTHTNTGEESIFARYVTFDQVESTQWSIDGDTLLKVWVHVLHQRWARTWDFTVESFIANY